MKMVISKYSRIQSSDLQVRRLRVSSTSTQKMYSGTSIEYSSTRLSMVFIVNCRWLLTREVQKFCKKKKLNQKKITKQFFKL